MQEKDEQSWHDVWCQISVLSGMYVEKGLRLDGRCSDELPRKCKKLLAVTTLAPQRGPHYHL